MRLLFLCLVLSISRVLSSPSDDQRVNCEPDPGHGEIECWERGKCSWKSAPKHNPQRLPECVRAVESAYLLHAAPSANTILLEYNGLDSFFGAGEKTVSINWTIVGAALEVKIAAGDKFTPPLNLPRAQSKSTETLSYSSAIVPGTQTYAFKIKRDSTGTVLWDTTIGGFFYSPQFMEISTYLPSSNVFGLGEHLSTKLKHDTTVYWDYPMFNTPRTPDWNNANYNLFGTHPFYLCVEPDGKAHGVLLFNSAPQEVVVGPILTYRTISGIFDIVFFPGPSPEGVIQQYTAYVGRPYLPAYWALGNQFGKIGSSGMDNLKLAVNKYFYNQIPLDVLQLNTDIEDDYQSFTVASKWSDLPAYVNQLHNYNMKVLVEVDPVLSVTSPELERAKDSDATFVVWSTSEKVPKINSKYPQTKNTEFLVGGAMTSAPVVFIDFLDPLGKTAAWWGNELKNFHNNLTFDGISLNRNEPQNMGKELECPSKKNDLDYPPYRLTINSQKVCLCEESICMESKMGRSFYSVYDTRNLYGLAQSGATQSALRTTTGKRGAVLSRSTFVSSGTVAGHWLDGLGASWNDLRAAVIGAMNFNMFGIPYVGSDICGSTGTPTQELCLRWHQLGAFHSLSRSNHDSSSDVDPGNWVDVSRAAKMALMFKYQYMPYLYSLHYSASLIGGTVIRPLFFEFPADDLAHKVDYQFLWGSALMVSPVTDPGVTTVRTYFPTDTWYSLSPNSYGSQMSSVYYQDVPAGPDTLTPVFVRGGYILPRQGANTTLTASRQNPFELLIAVKTDVTSNGEMYWDRGDDVFDKIENHPRHQWKFSFTYTDSNAVLNGTCIGCDATLSLPSLDMLDVIGYDYTPNLSSFTLNGNKVNINVQSSFYSAITRRLLVNSSGLITLTNQTRFSLQWSHTSRV